MFDICYHDGVVGNAEVTKEGLYYRFCCVCTPPDKSMYRIHVTDGIITKDLGICVPEKDRYILVTRVPMKYFKGEELTFILTSNKLEKAFMPVATDAPFEALDQLKTARFQIENGQPGILIDPAPDQPDSGQNQECEHRSL